MLELIYRGSIGKHCFKFAVTYITCLTVDKYCWERGWRILVYDGRTSTGDRQQHRSTMPDAINILLRRTTNFFATIVLYDQPNACYITMQRSTCYSLSQIRKLLVETSANVIIASIARQYLRQNFLCAKIEENYHRWVYIQLFWNLLHCQKITDTLRSLWICVYLE